MQKAFCNTKVERNNRKINKCRCSYFINRRIKLSRVKSTFFYGGNMKKILIIGIIILSIFIIYLTTLDKKVYYLVLGDEISLGLTSNNHYEKNYSEYIKEYLEEKKLLEKYINEYVTQNYRITDIINDIKTNKELEDTKQTLKNALIKADLVTISIGTNDIMSKIETTNKMNKIDYKKLKDNIESIKNDYEQLLKQLREYCK